MNASKPKPRYIYIFIYIYIYDVYIYIYMWGWSMCVEGVCHMSVGAPSHGGAVGGGEGGVN